MTRRHRTALGRCAAVGVALVLAPTALSACGGTKSPESAPGGPGGAEVRTELVVSAAASLSEVFERLGEQFMSEHPYVDLHFNFDSSSSLANQIIDGAPVDVFASADEANLERVSDRVGVEAAPTVIAANDLVIVTQPANPAHIEGLADLSTAGFISLCAVNAPCGKYTTQVLRNAGVDIAETSIHRGNNATSTLSAVTNGDAVAAIVYRSDSVRAGTLVETIEIPPDDNLVAVYPIAVLRDTDADSVAAEFVDFVSSADARSEFVRHGFLPPP